MFDLLHSLPAGARILDLGSASGSFSGADKSCTVIRLDLEYRAEAGPNFVVADAARQPFAPSTFDLVIANHSLEHIENLADCLAEIGRVTKPAGGLFVSVPDASTVTDKIYRWLARGGGHVNGIVSHRAFAAEIEEATGLRHNGTRTLCSSLSFLNRHNRRHKAPRRLLLLGGGSEWSLHALNYGFRLFDRLLKTRTSVYGWAFYFGTLQPESLGEVWTNVCIRCGAGHARRELLPAPDSPVPFTYRCPQCSVLNSFSDDRHFAHLVAQPDD